MKKAIILSSGGVDSTTCLSVAVNALGAENVSTASIFYGQKHKKELDAARAVAAYYHVPHYEFDLAQIMQYSNCSLLSHSTESIVHKSYGEQIAEKGAGKVSTYVPFRNGLMISVAASLAAGIYEEEETDIYVGAHGDDAAGEAFDKVARAIGLGYPGGPKIDKVSKEGNPDAIHFPRAAVAENEYDFSFSGLKSAVLNYLNGCQMKGEEINQADVAASFQKAVVDVLVEHTMQAARDYHMDKIAIAGGVASNGTLRAAMEEACSKHGHKFYRPSPIFCTDNAAMIGVAAYYEYIKGTRHGWDLNAVPNLKLGER